MAISFKGGKRYRRHNGLKAQSEIKLPFPAPAHFYPLMQGSLRAEPLVSEGDKVLCGQKLADIAASHLIPVISSISGTVSRVTADMITVENDMLYSAEAFPKPVKTVDKLTSREILWLLREGAVYERLSHTPLHVLLSDRRVADCIIVCLFDSDPYVSSPQAAADGTCDKVLRALDAAMRVSGINRAYVAVENDTKKTFSDYKLRLRFREDVTLFLLKARYPQSRGDILINTVTGNPDTNALILSPETLCNMADVLETGIPVTNKIVTISGDDILEPCNFSVPIGASAAATLESGGYTNPEIVINGGIIDGERITDLDSPVTADTAALIAFHDRKNIPAYRKKPL